MSAKKAASKKKTRASSKKSVVKKAKPKIAARSGKSSSHKTHQKPSSKKTVKSPTSTSQKKVSKHEPPTQKGQNKEVAKPAPSVAKKAPMPASPMSQHPAPRPAVPVKRRNPGNLLSGPVRGFTPYQPKRGEEYMNRDQLEHFRQLLLAWKRELMEEVDRTMLHMKDDAANFPDPNDRATQESEFGLELRTRDRERKLLKKIDSALSRIDDGSYGYCEETGDEIGLRRLEARPVATLCVEAQERRELAERQFRDREDQYR
jgi:RNA polymerase-binding transcription factor